MALQRAAKRRNKQRGVIAYGVSVAGGNGGERKLSAKVAWRENRGGIS